MVAESIEIFLDGQFWLDPEVFGPDQVAFARGMDVEVGGLPFRCKSDSIGRVPRKATGRLQEGAKAHTYSASVEIRRARHGDLIGPRHSFERRRITPVEEHSH